ncbi:MAG: PDDEXK nuclease domain-containing protein [Bacteroidales bacterium]|jgi:predicted nuclease of restriction endonuclease-like (RecB) superfamily|nr:PDDEXK nuclease domain-containing protein [Bacteroidales bacterium]
MVNNPQNTINLFSEIKQLIEEAKQAVAVTVNAATTVLYWNIGDRIKKEILSNKRAEYGKEVVKSISQSLTEEYGIGWSEKQLRHCLRIAETFPDKEILYALSRQLSWTHFRSIMYLKDDLRRDFYIEMTKLENWNTRTLDKKIESMLFERTAISKKPKELIKNEIKLLKEENTLSPDLVFRDPYFLNFLGLEDIYSEKTLEDAILRELEKFILELGQGFTFVERQKRMLIDGDSFKLDLLFYHRKLKRLVAIDLKLDRFKAQYKGQMELYLRYLEKFETEKSEESPIGLILCAAGSKEQIELLQLDKSGIRIAEYLLELPSKEILQKKLHKVIEIERKRLETKKLW